MMHEMAHVSLSSLGHDFGGVFDIEYPGACASAYAKVYPGARASLAHAPGQICT